MTRRRPFSPRVKAVARVGRREDTIVASTWPCRVSFGVRFEPISAFREVLLNDKLALFQWPLVVAGSLLLPAFVAAACSATNAHPPGTTTGGAGGSTLSSSSTHVSGMGGDIGLDGSPCVSTCSQDFHSVIGCQGQTIECTGTQACNAVLGICTDACQAAKDGKQAVGCEYYATPMDQDSQGLCFAAFIANTWNTPAHIDVTIPGASLPPIETFARIPSGAGPSLTYAPFDPVAGLAPGQVAILFLAGTTTSLVPCPVQPATSTGGQVFHGTDIGTSFRIAADVPVVAYQINPYGGGAAAVTGASLLLPTSVWARNYVAVTAGLKDLYGPSMNIIAAEDDTQVVMLPKAAITGGGKLASGAANMPYTFTLAKGQQAQFSQVADLTGSIIQSSKPIGFMAGHPCVRVPFSVSYCDHAEQMVPPIKALGSEYVGVMARPRVAGDMATWRLIGVVDGTQLTYSPNVGGPTGLAAGQKAEFVTDKPFHVESQDKDHPFMLFTYMTGSKWSQLANTTGYGDPDFVISVPPQQYLRDYVFFADPTYPETNLVVVRAPGASSGFDDVTLDCAGPLTGWQPVGEYEWTRIDLIRHDFVGQGNCTTGRHTITSKSPFGLWVWGWGTPETTPSTANVSYGYPGGMNVLPINPVVIQPVP